MFTKELALFLIAAHSIFRECSKSMYVVAIYLCVLAPSASLR